ncbi:hypothetical protein LHFGNBLO_001362 [Mesorhizobium sp. AR10]|uniref:primase-helicase family protein n=1 Tax=Mesorhizobium sp. AR10 TaxID=2865839 RepID=UPI00215E98B3|nr:DUF5906 domain-containing protein [Mesorhizobium sp. AR10]UVK39947.1 hypothetical protein LHFGNBLO_001362 [Mesorhizobium sp. AR10]
MSEPNLSADTTTITASEFLATVYPNYDGLLSLSKDGADANADGTTLDVHVPDVGEIDTFFAEAGDHDIVALSHDRVYCPAALAFWFAPGQAIPDRVKSLGVVLQPRGETAGPVLVVHVDGETAEVDRLISDLAAEYPELSPEVPLPGRRWSLEAGSQVRRCTVEQVIDAMLEGSADEAGLDADVPDHWNSAGDFPPGVLEHPLAASKMHDQFKKKAINVFANVHGLYSHIANHLASDKKEGPGIVGAVLDTDIETGKPRRKIRNVVTVGYLGLDFDGGQTEEEAAAKLRALGITFGTYSSYRHLKDGRTHKFRVIIPLKPAFDTSQFESRERANAVWKASYEAFCETHGFHYDHNAKDITRFFNSPRHPKGGEFFSRIYGGKLFELPIVMPEERPIAKIAKARGIALSYDFSGEAYVADGSGVEFFLSLLGDGSGQLGYHDPSFRVLCSYFATEGPDAEVGPIVQRLRQSIEKAERGPGREQSDIDRYMSDSYLAAEVENAREFIRERLEADEAAKQAQAEILAEAFEIAEKMTKLTPDEEVQTLLKKLVAVSEREAERVLAEVKKLTGTPIGRLREDYRNLRTKQAKGKARSPYHFETVEAGIEAMNKEIAIVERGTDVMIVQKREEQDGWKTIRAAETVFAPWEVGTNSDMEPLFPLWRKSHLRDYRTDVVFNPYRHGAIDPTPSEHYNLYKGLAIEPGMSDWMAYQRHVFHIVCNGDMRLFRFYMTWMADLFQNPETKPGTALMVRGLKGTGKSIFTVPLQQILGLRHSVKVSNRKHLTGNFNGQMAGKMLVIGEESSWGGDKEADSSLKDQITSDTMLLENKFADPVPMRDFRRFIIISNAKSVVRATPDERRYAATVVSDARIGDKAYFDTLAAEIYGGETAPAMLHDLLNLDITVDLRNPPKTAALADQIINALPADERWIRGVLLSGSFTGGDGVDLLDERTAEKWLTESIRVTKEMVRESYRSAVKPYDGPADPGTIGKFFVSKFKGTEAEIDDTRPGRVGRDYVLPPLPEMITAYEREWTPLNPETTEDEKDFIRVVDRNNPDERVRVETNADDFINAFFRR